MSNCKNCGKWAGAHATLPGQSRDHLCHCTAPASPAPAAMTAEPLKDWKLNHVQRGEEEGTAEIGYLDPEDDRFARIVTVDTGLYDQDDQAMPLAVAILGMLQDAAAPATPPTQAAQPVAQTKATPPNTPDDARALAQMLMAGADDPMWANHAEVNKATLRRAADALRFMAGQVECLAACVDPAAFEEVRPAKAARVHAIVNAGPLPGMSEAFDVHMGAACWTDPAYAPDASMWAAAWKAAKAQPVAQGLADQPMFWVRLRSDGGYEGPIHNDAIEEVRKRSGTWRGLYLESAPAVAQPPSKDTLIDLIAGMLAGTFHCTRTWSAWGVGTMSEDDFSPVDESDTPSEIADAVLALLNATPPMAPIADFQRRAQELAAEARRAGYVLTIEQQSLWPPAMGFHADVVSVRGAR